MKTNMNPDLEFLRGLMERCKLRESNCMNRSINSEKHGDSGMSKIYYGEASAFGIVESEISEYLKTRGTE